MIWRYRRRPDAGQMARRDVAECLARYDVPAPVASDIEVALGEAVQNAIRWAEGGSEVLVMVACELGRITLVVRDNGGGADLDAVLAFERGRSGADTYHETGDQWCLGQGLLMMDALTDDLFFDCQRDSTVVAMTRRYGGKEADDGKQVAQ